MLSIESRFASLASPPPQSGELTADRVPGSRVHRVAKDAQGRACFVVAAQSDVSDCAPVELQNLSIRYQVRCRIREVGGKQQEGVFTLITYTGPDKALRELFLRAVHDVLRRVGDRCRVSELSDGLDGLVRLFAALARPQRKTVQGLWAELFVIVAATDPCKLVEAWHAEPQDRYDFNAGTQRLEVKSASGRLRKHHFSLSQLEPPEGSTVVVVSLLMERAGAGTSLGELCGRARRLLTRRHDLQQRVDSVVADSLGESLSQALEVAFDEELARESLAFIATESIPRIARPLHAAITEVAFAVDVSACRIESAKKMSRAGGLLAAAVPVKV